MAKINARANTKALQVHDYCSPEDMETNAKGTKKLLSSPSKPPGRLKKMKANEDVNSWPQDGNTAVISTLQNMMEDFKTELKQNTLTVSNIAKAVEFNSAEIKECKENNKKLEKRYETT